LEGDKEFAKQKKYLKGMGGPMVVFGIKATDGKKAGQMFIDSLKLTSHVANVGDAKTLAIHPASTTHSQLDPETQAKGGISPGMVRLSVGLETLDDIIADINHAIKAATAEEQVHQLKSRLSGA